MKKAKDELIARGIQDNPCKDCTDCTVKCKKGFKVPRKITDITRVAQVPDDFLV